MTPMAIDNPPINGVWCTCTFLELGWSNSPITGANRLNIDKLMNVAIRLTHMITARVMFASLLKTLLISSGIEKCNSTTLYAVCISNAVRNENPAQFSTASADIIFYLEDCLIAKSCAANVIMLIIMYFLHSQYDTCLKQAQ